MIPQDLPLTTAFRKAGYFVCGAGKIYHEGWKRRNEWDDYLEEAGKDPEPKGNTGVGGIRFAPMDCGDEDLREWKIVGYGIEQLQKKHDKPLFLAVGLHKPHMPWNVPRKYFDLHPLDKIELPPHREDDLNDLPLAALRMAKPEGDHAEMLKSGRWKEAVQGYLAAISYCDAMVGRLLDAFDKSAYATNTIVCLWSYHGWHGVLHTIGLSIDTFPEINNSAIIEGVEMPIIEGFKKILSIDLVAEPAAGGRFARLIAAQTFSYQEDTPMNEQEAQRAS